jgi:hypothetical protein
MHHIRIRVPGPPSGAGVAILLLLCTLVGAGLAQSAAPKEATYLPIVTGTAPQPTLTTLLDCNCAGVSSTLLPDGRVLLTFQDHTRGSHVFSAIDGGDHLIDITLPPLAQQVLDTPAAAAAPAPAFQFPGPKQAPGSAIVVGQEVRWYVPSRDDDDPTGYAKLKRLTLPLSSLPPP